MKLLSVCTTPILAATYNNSVSALEGQLAEKQFPTGKTAIRCWRHRNVCRLAGIAVFLHLLSVGAHAEYRRIKFEVDLCSYEIRFRTEHESAVRGTIQLLTEHLAYIGAPIFVTPEDLAKIDLSKLDEQCAGKVSAIAGMPLLPIKGIEDYRRSLLEEINDTCRFERSRLAGYRDPSALRQYEATAACSIYVDALEGKADLHSVFRQVALRSCENNTNRQRCLNEAEKNVKQHVFEFGWNNCTNTFTKRNTLGNEKKRETLFSQFRTKYRVREIECDHP